MEVYLHAFLTQEIDGITPRSLYLRGTNPPRYPVDRTLDRPQSQSGRGVKRKIPILAKNTHF